MEWVKAGKEDFLHAFDSSHVAITLGTFKESVSWPHWTNPFCASFKGINQIPHWRTQICKTLTLTITFAKFLARPVVSTKGGYDSSIIIKTLLQEKREFGHTAAFLSLYAVLLWSWFLAALNHQLNDLLPLRFSTMKERNARVRLVVARHVISSMPQRVSCTPQQWPRNAANGN